MKRLVDLQSESHKNFFFLPSQSHFYGSQGEELISSLEIFLKKKNIDTFFIVQDFDCQGFEKPWLEELSDKLFADELARRIFKFRRFLAALSKSDINVVYVANGHCFDQFFELASCCKFITCFNSQSKFGFREIAAEGFPAGGFFEREANRPSRVKEKWRSRPILTAAQALTEGVVEFFCDTKNWSQHLDTWIKSHPKKFHQSEKLAFDMMSSEEPFKHQTKGKTFNEIEQAWQREKKASDQAESSIWDYCWLIIKERKWFEHEDDLDSLLSHIVAQFYLSDGYLSWAYINATKKESAAYFYDRDIPDTVYVDLNALAPPVSVLIKLLNSSVDVVLVGDDAKYLSTILERSFLKLEKYLGSSSARELWNQHVSWFVGRVECEDRPIMSWAFDDFLSIRLKDEEVSLLQLEGNLLEAKSGYCEYVGDKQEIEGQPVFSSLCSLLVEGIIATSAISDSKLPVSVWLRSLLIEEIIRLSSFRSKELESTVQLLAESGWGFASKEENWGRFLQTRYSSWASLDETNQYISNFGPSRSSWNIGTWKVARLSVNKEKQNTQLWNVHKTNQHLALFCGLLSKLLEKEGLVSSLQEADKLCFYSFGFPEKLGTPSYFLKKQGLKRVLAYSHKHWPSLSKFIG